MKFKPSKGKVFVTDLERGMQKSKGGILFADDNMKAHGIKPRWGQVAVIADDITDVKVGEWILLEHGRWSLKIVIQDDEGQDLDVWHADFPNGVLCISEEDPRLTERVEKL